MLSTMLGNVKLIITIIVASFAVDFVKSQCIQQTDCHCIGPDNLGYDLSRIEAHGPFFALWKDETAIAFQPCKNVNLAIPKVMPTSGNCTMSSLCLWARNNDGQIIGKVEDTRWQWTLHENPELVIKHNKYTTHIQLMCDNYLKKPRLFYNNATANDTKFTLELRSSQLCPVDMSPKGLSTGSVLVILFFVFSGVYFIGGMAVLTYCRGAIGRESIPNYEFWADLPALVRDGVTFTLSGCSTISYERI